MPQREKRTDSTPRREEPPKPDAQAAARQRARDRAGDEALPVKSGAPRRGPGK
jgi:hypothetical protein